MVACRSQNLSGLQKSDFLSEYERLYAPKKISLDVEENSLQSQHLRITSGVSRASENVFKKHQ